MSAKVAVITPTIGTKHLVHNLRSVTEQTYDNVDHIVVVDGPSCVSAVNRILEDTSWNNKKVLKLPENTGAEGYNGHRIYGAVSFLTSADYVIFLDEDNWIEPNHIETLVKAVKGYDWAFSFRKIIDQEGKYVCNDDCENLGLWPTVLSNDEYFVDVGCYFLPTKIAVQLSPIWYRRARHPEEQPEVDRLLMHVLRQNNTKYNATRQYTLNYRVGNRSDSVRADFFLRGNEIMKQKYPQGLPWNDPSSQPSETITLTF